MSADVRSQACAYARNGSISVVSATPASEDGRQAGHVIAYVAGQSRTYQVTLGKRGWSCTCEEPDCPHSAAVQLVTGHDGLARKPRESR